MIHKIDRIDGGGESTCYREEREEGSGIQVWGPQKDLLSRGRDSNFEEGSFSGAKLIVYGD